MHRSISLFLLLVWLKYTLLPAQPAITPVFDNIFPFQITEFRTSDNGRYILKTPLPLFTCLLNGKNIDPSVIKSILPPDLGIEYNHSLKFTLKSDSSGGLVYKIILTIENISSDTVQISNVVPFGTGSDRLYLTASGPPALARAKIFRPGCGPLDVILPDNAWELGYSSIDLNGKISAYGLALRTSGEEAVLHRYSTILPSGASVEYTLFIELFEGEWQNGLKKAFHERYLFDVAQFDEALFKRADLQWIRSAYVATIQFAWDQRFYDSRARKYTFYGFLEEGKKYFGGYDIYALWPTWPRLGLDQRNQWDLYADLPFGLPKLWELANYARQNGTRFFISYNPWDKSTRDGDQLAGMSYLIKTIGADGVVLDTRGSSSYELQAAADSVRDGVIMYSEGMAVPRDMQGILAGRVHDAIYYQPPLNLNKLIRPDFAIFRVCQLSEGHIHRETAISFFNGYGTEINTMAPGRPEGIGEEFLFLGKTTRILRENSKVFQQGNFTPLIASLRDSIYINRWENDHKTLFTIFSLVPQGHVGALFPVRCAEGNHFVSLWSHMELTPVLREDQFFLPVSVLPFPKENLHTRLEGSVECVAVFPRIIKLEWTGDSLFIRADRGNRLLIWKNEPSYQNTPDEYPASQIRINFCEKYGHYQGKLIFQLFDNKELIDELIYEFPQGWIRKINWPSQTEPVASCPSDMVEIPAGKFLYTTWHDDSFIPYPSEPDSIWIEMNRFFMDRYPVTNKQFYHFIQETGYRPADTTGYLRHWKNGMYPKGMENHPVVWVSIDDARAYARWAGKRLPTECEWQYAAQGTDGRAWPWGNEFHATKCNSAFGVTTPVDAFPKGKSPFKVEDLVGNVWQMTEDEYDNGSYLFSIIRGGSYFRPDASEWYIKGGPQPVNKRQILIRVAPGFDRSATVGFRCVKDALTLPVGTTRNP